MLKVNKFISIILGVILCFTMVISVVSCENTNNDDETVTVTDMLGEQVTVKKNPKKVACASRTTYDLLIAFGVADSIDGVYYSLLENEWSAVFDTKANERYSLAYQESYETYITRGVDIVFSPEKYITDGLKEHGIKALNVSLYGNPDFSGYVYFFADLVKQIWDSEEVAQKVDSWKAHMQNTISGIQSELAKHDDKQRTVYYVRGDKNKGVGYTDTVGSFTEYAYKVLGMKPLNDKFESNKPSAEEICEQNPDVFVVGGIYQKNLMNALLEEPYKNLDAVKNGQVFNIPIGLTMFEQLGVFSPVFLCDQANKLYPNYFNYDIKRQIQDLSKEFFEVELTNTEAQNMLNGLSREGNLLA
ncbi:MAG: ABC transporter substrate-binding protein [Bacillales bacterium]|nr:ABC transporter substrate-binding protein [Bacillales bacterium]